jgi:hypothetical protein
MKTLLRCFKVVQCAAVGLAIAFGASEVRGAAFTMGNLVVVQAGNNPLR